MSYRHTQHARTTLGEHRPDLPMAYPSAQAEPAGRATIPVRSLAPAQPCGPGTNCHHSADCPDHYCPGHPGAMQRHAATPEPNSAPHDAAAEPDLIFGAAAVTMCVFAWLLAALGFTLAAVL